MKQNITLKQLNELSDEQIFKLNKWMIDKEYYKPNKLDKTRIVNSKRKVGMNISIGQMIEFIDEHDPMKNTVLGLWHEEHLTSGAEFEDVELIDWLWMEMEETL